MTNTLVRRLSPRLCAGARGAGASFRFLPSLIFYALIATTAAFADSGDTNGKDADKDVGESSYNVRDCEPAKEADSRKKAGEQSDAAMPESKALDECLKQTP